MRSLLALSVLTVFLQLVSTNPTIEQNETVQKPNRHQLEDGFMRKLNTKCTQRDNSSCIMLKWMSYMNRMLKKSSIDFGKNISVTQTRSIDEIPSDPDDDLILSRAITSDDDTLGFIIADKFWKFLRSRTLRYKLLNEADIVVSTEKKGNLNVGISINPANAIESGRGKMKDMSPFIAVIGAKIGVLAALAFKGLILLVGKALLVSKVALLLAGILAVRKLISKKHVTYEVVAHPHHSESHHHHHAQHQPHPPAAVVSGHHDSYSAGWGRTFDSFMDGFEKYFPDTINENHAHEQAYAGQKKI